MRQADEDWLAHGLDGRSPKTIKKNQNVLEPILKVVGTRKLHELSAADVRQALATMAAGYSSAAVTMGHLALKRAIRHAEASDLVSRNVAALVDTPKGRQGRPSKSLTLDQAIAVITTAKTLPVMELRPGLKDVRGPAALMHAYIVLSLLCGIRTEEARPCTGIMSTWTATRAPGRPSRRTWPCGDRSAGTARPRPSGHAAPSAFPIWRWRRFADSETARLMSGYWPVTDRSTPDWCSPLIWALRSTRGTSGRRSNGSALRRASETAGRRASFGPHSCGVSIEEIARLAGHASTRTTEVVYRRELRPVITTGAEIMDEVFEGS